MKTVKIALIMIALAIIAFVVVAVVLTYTLGSPEVGDGVASAIPLPTVTVPR